MFRQQIITHKSLVAARQVARGRCRLTIQFIRTVPVVLKVFHLGRPESVAVQLGPIQVAAFTKWERIFLPVGRWEAILEPLADSAAGTP
jgi:hypothetical protein